MSNTKEQQLLSEVLLLQSYYKSSPEVFRGRGQHGYFYKTFATSKGATLKDLVRTGWCFGNEHLCRLKKNAMAEDRSVSTALRATPNKSDSTNEKQCAAISNREVAKSVYTAKKLFALNQCRHEKNTSLDFPKCRERTAKLEIRIRLCSSLPDCRQSRYPSKRR
jgi:hypothetical protein